MPLEPDYLLKISILLNEALEQDVMHVAQLLLSAYQYDKALFPMIAAAAGIKRRRAYALVQIARKFQKLGFANEQLNAIGWTKLALLARHINSENAVTLVQLAASHKAHELEKLLAGAPMSRGTKSMLFRLSPSQDLRLRKLLIAHGASGSLAGLTGKEAALVAMMDKLEITGDHP